MTLRLRFGLIIGGLVAFILVLFMGSYLVMEQRYLASRQEEVQKTQANQLARACVEARFNHDEMPILKLFKDLEMSPGFVEGMCLDGTGKVTLHSALKGLGEQPVGPTLPAETLKVAISTPDGERWAYNAPGKKGGPSGGARVVFDPRPVRDQTRRTLRATLARLSVVAAGILGLALILSWVVAENLTRPIQQLAAGARRLGTGEWDTRVGDEAPGELGVLAQEFNSMSRKLGELDRLKDQFVYAVSHDLRNPLTAILASSKMLRQDCLPEGSKTLIEVIETGVTRLSAMVNNILDVACLQERTLSFSFLPFALEPLLKELVRLYEPLAGETGKTIVIDVPPALPPLNADEEKVFRVFLNLLSNAIKFTRSGDRITLSARPLSPQWVECRVGDTGPGIAPERLKEIFLPFRSKGGPSPDGKNRPGSGLGLSLVKALIEGHGGVIRVESTPGVGTTFVFTLPWKTP